MVKTRKDRNVVTALPVSKPADVPVVSALAEESIPDKAPQPSPSSPSTSGAEADTRPVRVYADGTADDSCFCHRFALDFVISPQEFLTCFISDTQRLWSRPRNCK